MKVTAMAVVAAALLLAMGLTMAAALCYYEGRGLQAFVAAALVVVCLVVGWFAAWAVDLAEEQGM